MSRGGAGGGLRLLILKFPLAKLDPGLLPCAQLTTDSFNGLDVNYPTKRPDSVANNT
jgi:hypothetical protein